MNAIIGKLVIVTMIHNGASAVSAPSPYLQPIPKLATLSQPTFKPIAQLQPVVPPAPTSFAVAPAGTYSNSYAFGNCTAYVASRKAVPNSWGNAATWAPRAAAQGITVSGVPIVGSIAQEGLGLGHVAIVESVGNGTVTVSEANVLGLNVVDSKTYPVSHFQYIYV